MFMQLPVGMLHEHDETEKWAYNLSYVYSVGLYGVCQLHVRTSGFRPNNENLLWPDEQIRAKLPGRLLCKSL
jgi:hypothetical protein